MQKHIFFIVTSVLLFNIISPGQIVGEYVFTHYGPNVGLISNQINSIVQDDAGFIWIATTDGLQRFDGVRYRTFRHRYNDSNSIPSNPVRQLMLDNRKNLWVLTEEGQVGKFSTKNFTYHNITTKAKNEIHVRSAIKRLIKDESGNVFLLLTGNSLLTYNEKRNEMSEDYNLFENKNKWGIADFIHQPGTQKYWISIQDSGIAIYNNATKQMSCEGNNVENEPAIDKLNGIGPSNFMFDKKGRLWFDTWRGYPIIYCYDARKNEIVLDKYDFLSTLKSYYETKGFLEQQDGTVWIKGAKVFARYMESEKKFEQVYNGYLNEHSITFEAINSFYEDREKNIWVGTSDNGLYRFNPAEQFFRNVAHTNRLNGNKGSGSPMSFIYTKWGTILAGTWGDGLYHYDNDLNLIPINIRNIKEEQSIAVWGMFASKDSNTIWMAAQPGILKIDQDKRIATHYNPPLMQNRTVRQIAEDTYGNLWLGMQSTGVYKWNAEKGKKKFEDGIEKFTGLPSRQVNKITVDSKGYVWIAMPLGGVSVIDPATDKIVMRFSNKDTGAQRIAEEGVSSVLEYNDSIMVITMATRILIYNRNKDTSYLVGTPETMSGYIAAIEKDKNGYLWVANSNGLYRVNIYNRIFVRFNRDDGIDNDNFVLAASRTLPDGRMLFGNSTMFLVFDPSVIHVNTEYPDVVITDFRLRNRSLLVDSLLSLENVALKADENSVVLEFSTLSFGSAYIIKYKMEGLDKEWKIADKNYQAIYSYLPPGAYTFLVKSEDAEGNPSKNITRLNITVNPPFWQAWWFYSALVLLIGGILFWLDKERMKRKEAIQKMRSGIAGNLHEEINTALNNINILSEMARIKAEKDPEKSIEYIEQIHTKSHNMIIAMDDMLWSINPENDSMQKTVDRMREYIDALNNRHGLEIKMDVDKNVAALELNMRLRHEAFLLFKEGVKALTKACASKCMIHVSFEKLNLLYSFDVNNNSCKTHEFKILEQNQDLSRRLNNIHGTMDVQVHKTHSVILLRIPVK